MGFGGIGLKWIFGRFCDLADMPETTKTCVDLGMQSWSTASTVHCYSL